MATITIEIPEGKRAEWVNNVLTLVADQPKVEFKFKVGDKVIREGHTLTIRSRYSEDEMPCYITKENGCVYYESELEPYTQPQDITERIKTFEDACEWCNANGLGNLVTDYLRISNLGYVADILAYLKLRIITCALNEGWEPTFGFGEQRWLIFYDMTDCSLSLDLERNTYRMQRGNLLLFKSKELAEYAADQFKDIYMDFCCKGKE